MSFTDEDLRKENAELYKQVENLLEMNEKISQSAERHIENERIEARKENEKWEEEKKFLAMMFDLLGQEKAGLELAAIQKDRKIHVLRDFIKFLRNDLQRMDGEISKIVKETKELNAEAQSKHDKVVRLERRVKAMEDIKIGNKYLKEENEKKQQKIDELMAQLTMREGFVPSDSFKTAKTRD